MDMAFCNNCGAALRPGDRFCNVCGTPVGAASGAAAGPAPVSGVTVRSVYERTLKLLAQKPLRLWGLSLMCTLLTVLAGVFGVLPILFVPITFVLTAGMKAVYLAGIRGEEVNSDQLFSGFSSFFRLAAGMGWMALWVLIWGLIPVVGIVFAVIKAYSYRFTPYLLMSDPSLSATQALRKSMEMTDGLKGRMFGADALLFAALLVGEGLLSALAMIPGVGIVFAILFVVFALATAALAPLCFGILEATFYDEKVSGKA